MLNVAGVFNELAGLAARQFGGVYHDGEIVTRVGAVIDAGGSIVTPGSALRRACRIQIDAATEAMRASDGFAEGDVRFLILSASLTGALDTDAVVVIAAGSFAGRWLVSGLERDPAAIGYAGRGRRG